MTIEIPADLEPFLIGLWRFREAGQPRQWCTTYCWRGKYYDTLPVSTPQGALISMRHGLIRLRAGLPNRVS